MYIRTDLAMEERELWQKQAGQQTQLPGVAARTRTWHGIRVTNVDILNEQGSAHLHKPMGHYVTLELGALQRREKHAFSRAAQAVADELEPFLQKDANVLVVGLGNEAVTPDAVGPLALESLIVTRHLKTAYGTAMSGFRTVSAARPGVLGTTGVESVEMVRGVAERTKPDQIIVIDALAANDPGRMCSSVQIADTGIVPGSGVGNSRAAFNEQTLGVPVLAIGVPTVVDASNFLAEGSELGTLPKAYAGLIVTPRDIDAKVQEIARLIGYSLDLALHPGLRLEDIPCFLP